MCDIVDVNDQALSIVFNKPYCGSHVVGYVTDGHSLHSSSLQGRSHWVTILRMAPGPSEVVSCRVRAWLYHGYIRWKQQRHNHNRLPNEHLRDGGPQTKGGAMWRST